MASAYDDVKNALFLQGVYRDGCSTAVYKFLDIDTDNSRIIFEERGLTGRRRTVGLRLVDLTQLIPISSQEDLNLLRRCGLSERDIPDGSGID